MSRLKSNKLGSNFSRSLQIISFEKWHYHTKHFLTVWVTFSFVPCQTENIINSDLQAQVLAYALIFLMIYVIASIIKNFFLYRDLSLLTHVIMVLECGLRSINSRRRIRSESIFASTRKRHALISYKSRVKKSYFVDSNTI